MRVKFLAAGRRRRRAPPAPVRTKLPCRRRPVRPLQLHRHRSIGPRRTRPLRDRPRPKAAAPMPPHRPRPPPRSTPGRRSRSRRSRPRGSRSLARPTATACRHHDRRARGRARGADDAPPIAERDAPPEDSEPPFDLGPEPEVMVEASVPASAPARDDGRTRQVRTRQVRAPRSAPPRAATRRRRGRHPALRRGRRARGAQRDFIEEQSLAPRAARLRRDVASPCTRASSKS